MIIKLLRQFRANPLKDASFHPSPNGQIIWRGVVAIERPDLTDPILFTHPSIAGVTAKQGGVRIEKGNLVWKRSSKPDVVISGFDLKRVDDYGLDWDWEIFRAPERRDLRHRQTILE